MADRASSHAVTPEASALQAEHDRHALALGVAVAQLEAMEPPPIHPVCAMVGTIRVMQFNILADGLSDDGFLLRDCLQVRGIHRRCAMFRPDAITTTY